MSDVIENEIEDKSIDHETHDYRIIGCYKCDERAKEAIKNFRGSGWDYEQSEYKINA